MLQVQQLCLAALVWLLIAGLNHNQYQNPQAAYLAPNGAAPQTMSPEQMHLLDKLADTPMADTQSQTSRCHAASPFLCPSSTECIPLDYLCDGTPDCSASGVTPAGFDEDPAICRALGRRPPSDESESLFRILVADRVDRDGHKIRKLYGAHLIKRSGISDQILAEIQMNRALRKQVIERAKQAAINGAKSESTTSA